jgi:multiple antibiotic resistance protein
MAETVFHAFITFFVIIDPVGIGPMFVALTLGEDEANRRRLAVRGTVIATAVLFVFAFVGEYLFRALGITLAAFSIAGGALLFLLAIDMVLARRTGLRSTTLSEDREAGHKEDISVFPLAIPLIAGPGALTSVLLLMTRTADEPLLQAAVLAVLLVVMGLTLALLLFASRVMKYLGVTGINVVSRVLGIILAALAVQLIVDGIAATGLVT